MLSDIDAGSVIAAVHGGAQWGYRLLFLQVVLIPVLSWFRNYGTLADSRK